MLVIAKVSIDVSAWIVIAVYLLFLSFVPITVLGKRVHGLDIASISSSLDPMLLHPAHQQRAQLTQQRLTNAPCDTARVLEDVTIWITEAVAFAKLRL